MVLGVPGNGVVVQSTAIAFVDVDAAGLDPGQRFQLGDDRSQGVAIKGVAEQGLGVQHKLAAFRPGGRGCRRDLAAELVRRPGFAFADVDPEATIRGCARLA